MLRAFYLVLRCTVIRSTALRIRCPLQQGTTLLFPGLHAAVRLRWLTSGFFYLYFIRVSICPFDKLWTKRKPKKKADKRPIKTASSRPTPEPTLCSERPARALPAWPCACPCAVRLLAPPVSVCSVTVRRLDSSRRPYRGPRADICPARSHRTVRKTYKSCRQNPSFPPTIRTCCSLTHSQQ